MTALLFKPGLLTVVAVLKGWVGS